MPSLDDYHKKHPKVNAWMQDEARREAVAVSGQIERLARRLDVDAAELAKKIPADTIRRTKYPVIEQVDAEGRRTFKPDPGIVDDGRKALVRR